MKCPLIDGMLERYQKNQSMPEKLFQFMTMDICSIRLFLSPSQRKMSCSMLNFA